MSTPTLRQFIIDEISDRLNKSNDQYQHIFKLIGVVIGFSFALFLGVVALIISFNGISEAISGNLRNADTYAGIASGLSSVILVILTAWYSLETRRMVRAQEEARKTEKAELWYGGTLAIIRQLEDRWESVEDSAAVRDFGGDTEFYVTDEELLREIQSLVTELFEQNSQRPSSVSNELSDSILRVYFDWTLSRSGGHTFTQRDNILSDELPIMKRLLQRESEVYGEE